MDLISQVWPTYWLLCLQTGDTINLWEFSSMDRNTCNNQVETLNTYLSQRNSSISIRMGKKQSQRALMATRYVVPGTWVTPSSV